MPAMITGLQYDGVTLFSTKTEIKQIACRALHQFYNISENPGILLL